MQPVLVRHALPEKIHAVDGAGGSGPADPGLTEAGQRQSARLVDALVPDGVDGLYASPLARARATAARSPRRWVASRRSCPT